VIADPTTDRVCLGQLTRIAREIAPTTLIRTVASRLASPRAVISWLQSLPQSDDDGRELYRYVACDVSQRVRLLPDDPNCFERSLAALMLLEVLDPETRRMLVTIDRPLRHTGVVESRGGRWVALDLFPRRNFNWGNFGKDVLQGVHKYVGKPLLSTYGLGGVADVIGEQQDKAIGRGPNQKKPQPPTKPEQPKQPAGKQPAKPAQPAGKPSQPSGKQLAAQQPAEKSGGLNLGGLNLGALTSALSGLGGGSGAKETHTQSTTSTKGGGDEEKRKDAPLPSHAAARTLAADGAGDPQGETGEEPERGAFGWPHE